MTGLCGVELPQNNATAIFFDSVAHFVAYITPECPFRYHCVTRHWAVFSLYFCYTADKLEYNKNMWGIWRAKLALLLEYHSITARIT